ncbi:hypothetical protein [Sporosarcina sp. UB5]|uniref:hypothetical protein n=1 Tax=Sporosarcina sp. UB5 TaxID=3047463 RepID=UPI003D7B85EA
MKNATVILLVFAILFPFTHSSIVEAKLSSEMNTNYGLSKAIPSKKKRKCEVEVPYDISVVKNTQKSVDLGHSPWNLDPVFVAQVFASLQLSPKVIIDDDPIAYDDLKVIKQTDSYAIVKVKSEESPIATICLKRLVRQDETGIWTVVGYGLKK